MFKTPTYIGDLDIDLAELSRSEVLEVAISADVAEGEPVFIAADGTAAPAAADSAVSGVALEAGVSADGDRVKVCIGGRCDAVCGTVAAGDRLAVKGTAGQFDVADASDLRVQAVALEADSGGKAAVRLFRTY